CVVVTAVAAVIHVRTNLQDLLDPFAIEVPSFRHQRHESSELREVSLLLGGQESERLKERDHASSNCREVIHLEVPHSISPLPHRPTPEVSLELGENDLVALGDVEAEGDLPRHSVVASRPEGDIEAPLAIRKASQVVPDFDRD